METRFTKNRILIGVLIGIVLLLALWLMLRPAAVGVETAIAERGQLAVTVDAEGKTRLKDKVVVTAPLGGKMTRLKIREGELIPKEFVIAEIDPNPPAPRPPSETENRINPYAMKIYAPLTGRVLRILEKNERIVPAGTPIVELGNPSTAEIVVDVLSTEAAQIRPGALVLIDPEMAAEPVRARVRTVESQAFTKVSALGVEEQRVNVIADFLSKNASFGDNFRVDVRIVVWDGENVLKIPSSALFRRGEKWNVFVVESGRARLREVIIGHQNAAQSEILEGLREGESVVLHPANQLTDGASVKSRS